MKVNLYVRTSVAALSLCVGLASPAQAQDGAGATSASSREDGLAEIVVTAQRREENLQDVPIAATALSGDQLNDKAVERLADLQFAAPSLSITDQGLTQSVNLRGIGIASGSPAVANGVAQYVDGVFQPPIMTASSFYDIATIEVLRGPQGTLVGSNSTGGAIFINTQNPNTAEVGGYAEAHYGSYDAVGLEGAINLPVTDTLAFRVAGNTRWRDSYYEDTGPFDNKPGALDEQAVRLGVLWEPENFRALAKVEWIDKKTGGYAYRPIAGTTFANSRLPDIRSLTYNAPTRNDERGFHSSLELRYELGGGIILRSVSGYLNKRINNLYDNDGAAIASVTDPAASFNQVSDQFVRERQWTQEFNIISPTDGVFDWILGGYYQQNKIDVIIENRSGDFVADPVQIRNFPNKKTYGLFTQVGYEITPGVEVQAGARYSSYDVTGTGSVAIGVGGPIFGPTGLVVADLAGSHKDGRLTGKLALNWEVNSDHNLYVFVSRGYKPGGANNAVSEFGPETVIDYEFGWKGAFLDNHLRTQFGAFYMDYSDFQFDALEPLTGQAGVVNIANATIKGLEFQAQAEIEGFGFDVGLAYVDSSLDSVTIVNQRNLPQIGTLGPQCPQGTASNPPVCFDYAPFQTLAGGGPNLFSPKWSYNFGVQYKVSLGDDATLTPRLNYAYVGSRWTNLLYNPALDFLPGRGLLSAQLTLDIADWSIEAYGTNLAKKKYVSGQSGNNEFYGAPREFGVRASVRF